MFTKRINSVDEPFDMPSGHTGRIAILDIEATHRKPGRAHPLEIGAVISDPLDPGAHLRPENQYRQIVRISPSDIFRPGTDVEALRASGVLSDLSHPSMVAAIPRETREALLVSSRNRPGEMSSLLEQSLFSPEAVSPQQAVSSLSSWMEEKGATAATAYNIGYDRTVLERFGLDVNWGSDIMHRARETLGLRSGEGSAENVGQLLGILGSGEKELHRGLEDAVLEAGIWHRLGDPAAVESGLSALGKIRGEKQGVISGLGKRMFRSMDMSMFKNITAENAGAFVRKNPVLAVAGAGAALFAVGAITKPLASIPGKDDAYNTLPGLNEDGMAADLRKIHTDFGSGYQGLKVMGQPIAPEIQAFREAWYSDLNDQKKIDQLRAQIAASGTEYGKFAPEEMQQSGNLKEVDLSNYDAKWDDADTLILRRTGLVGTFFGKKDIAIRLTGIDAPESLHPDDPTDWFRFRQKQPFSEEATAIAEALTAGKKLKVMIDPSATTYGRYLGVIYAEGDTKSVNEQLVESGAAAHLPFGEAGSEIYDRKAFASAEKQAIESKTGMWQEPFFQTYLDVAKGVGGRLTFNTLTDLSRLSRNYKLAAAQQAMWSAQETGEDQNAYRIGKSLQSSYGRFFHNNQPNTSGKDDDHLKIEALGHSGIASSMRQEMTDFGSGWRGIIGRIFKGKYVGASGLAGEVRALSEAAGEDLGMTFLTSKFKHQVMIDVGNIGKHAEMMGVTRKEYLQGVIKHERYHQEVFEHGLREELTKLDPGIVPKEFVGWAAERGYISQEAQGSASLIEEYFAWAHTASKFKKSSEFTKMFEPAWQRLGIKPRSAVMRKLEMAEAQKVTQMQTSTDGIFGGKGHTRYTNKSGG